MCFGSFEALRALTLCICCYVERTCMNMLSERSSRPVGESLEVAGFPSFSGCGDGDSWFYF